jgi:hypothetical protein
MKNFIRISFCFLFLTVAGSCTDSLDEKIFSNQNQDDFYKNAEEATLALSGVYGVLWDYIYKDAYQVIMGDLPGEVLHAGLIRNEFDLFAWTVSTSNFDNFWIACYKGINRANSLIDKMNPSIPATSKNSIQGQAKFLRALYYFHLVKAFGGVPLHIKATVDFNSVSLPRSSVAEVYAQIITDLKEAETLLGTFSASNHSAGYATSGAAKALLAKVYLQNKQWSDASTKAKEVMDLGVYGLFADYSLIWKPENKNGIEQIFSVQNGSSNNIPGMGDNTYRFMGLPKVIVNNKQVEFAIDGDIKAEGDTALFRREPKTYRLWNSVRTVMPYYFPVSSFAKVNDTVSLIRPYIVKFFHPDLNTKLLRSGVNTTILRYSDILLTYAEAINEQGGPNAEALEALNKVRRRARAVGTAFQQPEALYPDITSAVSQQEFREILLLERAREFVGEGERRNDLNRHDRLLKAAADQGATKIKNGYVLYPIPNVQVGLNPLLQQNPDY